VLLSPKHGARREIAGAESTTTNNRMELTAAICALQALKEPCSVQLYTDSQYVHHAFHEGWLDKWQANGWRTSEKKAVSNEDLWRELMRLSKRHDITWHWVRGHASTTENIRADELAVKARLELAAKLAGS